MSNMNKATALTTVLKELKTDIMRKYVTSHVGELCFVGHLDADESQYSVLDELLVSNHFVTQEILAVLIRVDNYVHNATTNISPLEELVYIACVQKPITSDVFIEYFNKIDVTSILEDYIDKAGNRHNNYVRNLYDSILGIEGRDVSEEERKCYFDIAKFGSPLLLTHTADVLRYTSHDHGVLLINRLLDNTNVHDVITHLNKQTVTNGEMLTTVGFSNLIIKACK